MKRRLTVVQCWDDGVDTDVRLCEILRRHKARATFNLNAGVHEAQRKLGWKDGDREIWRLGWNEMKDVYAGFTIANHSLTHPHLPGIPADAARRDVAEGRDRLRQFFHAPILGFAWPFGSYNETVMEIVREAGHAYARTVVNVDRCFPPEDPMAFHPCCHALAADFWSRYEKAKEFGVFYFWGHSFELTTEAMWADFAAKIARISSDPDVDWGDVIDLFKQDGRP